MTKWLFQELLVIIEYDMNNLCLFGSSVVENYVLRTMMIETRLEDKRKKLLSKITIALRKLNVLELQVFDLTFYKKETEETIMDIIFYGKDKMREIKKSACIKFLTALRFRQTMFQIRKIYMGERLNACPFLLLFLEKQ